MKTERNFASKSVWAIMGSVLFLMACNNDELDNRPVAAQITADIEQSVATRTTVGSQGGTIWESGDEIGITTSGNGEKEYTNIRYTATTQDGKFEGDPIYFQDATATVTFTAYYPFNGNEGTASGILENETNAENQDATGEHSKQSQIDYLWDETTGSNGQPNIDFSFKHCMSQITLIFQDGLDTEVSKIKAYSIDGLVLEGIFNTANGEAKSKDTEAKEVSFNNIAAPTSKEALPSLIFYPQEVTDVTLKITLDGQPYSCQLDFSKFTPADKLEAGNNYTFTITVNKTGMTVNTSNIEPWNNDNQDTGDAEMS